jgi:MYND finger
VARSSASVCDHCGKPAARRMLACIACSACQIVRYCDAACQLAGWDAHEAECKAERMVREESTGIHFVKCEQANAA